MSAKSLRIITRTSRLAMWQAEHIRDRLLAQHPSLVIEIIGIKTKGDRWLETPLQKIGGKGLFVKELEQALLNNEADIAVHSLKDLPAHFPPGLELVAICERETPLDAWVCPKGHTLATIPAGCKVGTSSLRRSVQLKALRPDLEYLPLRGNVDTRLNKCFAGEWDAIVLAAAGLKRLNLFQHVTEVFQPHQVLPAVGQGALAIESRVNDEWVQAMVSVLEDVNTRACISAERAMNAALGGNCQIPVAGFAIIKDKQLHLTGRVGHPEQLSYLEASALADIQDATALGEKVAELLIAQGAKTLIDDILRHGS